MRHLRLHVLYQLVGSRFCFARTIISNLKKKELVFVKQERQVSN
ncbi:unnamed protein product [Acanthoscelides obtectus]|uniref:Uncharacterized protein n=1 Tax=Acanthoscelides obtectus TaxID=200917 RepID=A0A9P0K9L1_ACAOB|nr:unnamed protein product [Acanthoscelides obtectus]CAK1634159.1 hypothetical protein AOBTE_LOCUS8638 [Acanthoscelides obtectus]